MHLLTLCALIIAPPNSLHACLETQSGVTVLTHETHHGCINCDPLTAKDSYLTNTSISGFSLFNFYKLVSEEIWQ